MISEKLKSPILTRTYQHKNSVSPFRSFHNSPNGSFEDNGYSNWTSDVPSEHLNGLSDSLCACDFDFDTFTGKIVGSGSAAPEKTHRV